MSDDPQTRIAAAMGHVGGLVDSVAGVRHRDREAGLTADESLMLMAQRIRDALTEDELALAFVMAAVRLAILQA